MPPEAAAASREAYSRPFESLDHLMQGTVPTQVIVGDGNLKAITGVISDQLTVVIEFDYGKNLGSIGVREASQLVLALRHARENRLPVILLIESCGIRVTDETAGIASLRLLIREALDCRSDGIRMLAIVHKCAFGGASLLASCCNRILVYRRSLFSMSGPRLIEATVGEAIFHAGDIDAVHSLIGGLSRAEISKKFRLIEANSSSVREAVIQWLEESKQTMISIADLSDEQLILERRLSSPIEQPALLDLQSSTVPRDVADLVSSVIPGITNVIKREGVFEILPSEEAMVYWLALVSQNGATANDTLALSGALLLGHANFEVKRSFTLLVDCESHSALPDSESVVLSELLGHLAMVIQTIRRLGRQIEVVVVGRGGGGIQSALASGATRVSMMPTAQLFVLPKKALGAINKVECFDAGTVQKALSVGAIDMVYQQNVIAKFRSEHVVQSKFL